MSQKQKNNTNQYGEPLDLANLNVDKLANKFKLDGVRTTTGFIQQLHDTQKQVIDSHARYKVLACGRRWGKSMLCTLVAAAALLQPGRRVWIVAPDYSLTEKIFREIYHIFVTQLQLITPGGKDGSRASFQKGEYYLKTPWGSICEGKSADNLDSLVGESIDLLIFDEAALETQLDVVWNQMLQPTLIDRRGSAIFISTPRGPNYFYKLFLLGKGVDSEWESFQFTTYDNPYIPSDEVDKAYQRALKLGQGINFKQEYLADFESIADKAFPVFREAQSVEGDKPHVIDLEFNIMDGPVFVACDFNYARPASTIYAQVNSYGDVFIFDEDFIENTTSYKQAINLVEKIKKYQIRYKEVVADVSGAQVNPYTGRSGWDDFYSVLGHYPKGTKQTRQVGSDIIRLWLDYPTFDQYGKLVKEKDGKVKSYPKLFISKKCSNMIYALQTLKFKKGKKNFLKEDYEEHPEGYEGLVDCLRYLLVHLFHDKKAGIEVVAGF